MKVYVKKETAKKLLQRNDRVYLTYNTLTGKAELYLKGCEENSGIFMGLLVRYDSFISLGKELNLKLVKEDTSYQYYR